MKLKTRQVNALAAKHITNPMQLRRWLPIRYINNTVETGVDKSLSGAHVTVIGTLISVEKKDMVKRDGVYILAKMQDRKTSHNINIRLFGMYYKFQTFCQMTGKEIVVGGKLNYHDYFGYSIDTVDTFSDNIAASMVITPVFSKVKGCSDRTMQMIIRSMISHGEAETVPQELLAKHSLKDINTSVKDMMYPASMADAQRAKGRLIYDDLFCTAGQFVLADREDTASGITATKDAFTEQIIQNLPYTLTSGQQDTYTAIKNRMFHGERVHALVQGDVGCGKTITAFLAMFLTVENGYQATMIAPTKILAEQHYKKLTDLLRGTNMKVVLIAGKAPKKAELEAIADGTVQFVIGTHGILSDKVQFKNLGLFVVDEEHKFGVSQRETITNRQKNVNTISMSATPIPRTLTSALYSKNTQIYNISTMPAGRKPVITTQAQQETAYGYVEGALERKEQCYVVCPAIELEDDAMPGVLSAKDAEGMYKKRFPQARIAELDGTKKQDETDKILGAFRAGEIDILISTTVVEVGVDVANATVMVIESAERFGLAGMHQLRGRVGRGSKQSYCILVPDKQGEANARLNALCSTNDGFKIAEMDMKELRLSGDLFGDQQSGYNKYVQEILRYPKQYQEVLKEASETESSVLEKHISKTLRMDTPKGNVLKIKTR